MDDEILSIDEPRVEIVREAITRADLQDGTFMERVRTIDGVTVPTDDEMDAALSHILMSQPRLGPLWVFGYGSLMWNPAFEYEEAIPARVRGWRRRFCLWTPFGRGTVTKPALTLALDNGGSTTGVAFRLPPSREREELSLIWRREMFSGAYRAVWVTVNSGFHRFPALTFVADRTKLSYAGILDDKVVQAHVAMSSGSLGTGIEYLENMVSHLEKIGFRDRPMSRLHSSLSPIPGDTTRELLAT